MSYAMNATGSSSVGAERPRHDFRPTPPEPTEALIKHYAHIIEGEMFHDGSCGDGAICKVLNKHGHVTYATDLIERGHGDDLFAPKGYGDAHNMDFLKMHPERDFPLLTKSSDFSAIINPPFSHWKEFVYKCHELEFRFIAVFAKMQIWNAGRTSGRIQLWHEHPPKAIHPLTWRVDFDGRGRPTMDCCWCVWGDNVPFSNQPLERV